MYFENRYVKSYWVNKVNWQRFEPGVAGGVGGVQFHIPSPLVVNVVAGNLHEDQFISWRRWAGRWWTLRLRTLITHV